MDKFLQDLSYGARMLIKSPGFVLVAVLTLALGIGANTAIFSVVNGVLLNSLPYPHPEQLVSIFTKMPNFENASISYPNFEDWRRMNRTFTDMAAYRPDGFNLMGRGEPERLHGEMISAGFFEIFGVNPLLGRTFSGDEDQLGANPTVMITEGLWKRKYGSDPKIIGQRMELNGVGRTIIGVVPSSFHLHIQNFQSGDPLNDVYVPVGEWNEPVAFHNNRGSALGLKAIGRLKPGITLVQAREDMDRASRELAAAYPDINGNKKANLIPLREEMVGKIRPALMVLLGSVAFVLLIACVNVANLLLARSTGRNREFAIRVALGAGKRRIVRQMLTESILLALIGGALGVVLAKVGTAAAIAAMPAGMPRAEDIHLDARVLLFTFAVSLVAGIAFGVVPALKTSRSNVSSVLKESGRSLAGARSAAQSLFVVGEMAMALVLLVGAGLMVRTLFVLWGLNPGFNPHNVIEFSISGPPSFNGAPGAVRSAWRELHDKLASLPGVEAVSFSNGASPMQHDNDTNFWILGRPMPPPSQLPMTLQYVVESEYLKTMQLSLKRGRFLTSADNEHAPAVTVIDETFAAKYFPGEDPVGHYIDLNTDPSDPFKWPNPEIVGVVGHVNQWGLDSDATFPLQAQMYLPMMQIPDSMLMRNGLGAEVYLRTARPSVPSFEELRHRLLDANGQLVVFSPQSMDEVVAHSIAQKRFSMTLLAVFAGIALLLASIGIYGVLSYLVGQRTQEIGVRIALGAQRFDVLQIVLSDGARMTLLGAGIGIVAALALTRLMSSMLFGVKPTDPITFVGVAVVLCGFALLACYVPAHRAMNVDPIVALRYE